MFSVRMTPNPGDTSVVSSLFVYFVIFFVLEVSDEAGGLLFTTPLPTLLHPPIAPHDPETLWFTSFFTFSGIFTSQVMLPCGLWHIFHSGSLRFGNRRDTSFSFYHRVFLPKYFGIWRPTKRTRGESNTLRHQIATLYITLPPKTPSHSLFWL